MKPILSANGTPASDTCFGTMQFGSSPDKDSAAVYAMCRAEGINFFDTAHVYTNGASETLLGELAAGERESLVISTKCASMGGSGRANILAQFAESQKRMNSDYFDVYFLHRWDADTKLEETFEVMAALRNSGKIRMIGVSNFSAWQTMKAQAVANKMGVKIEILQPMYNLVKRQIEVEILPMAVSEELYVIPYSPLGGGLLTGKYAGGSAEGRIVENKDYVARYAPDWMKEAAINLGALAAEHNTTSIALAVAWVKRNPAITAPIISGRTEAQLAPSLAGAQMELSDELYAAISALTPTPPPATDRLEEQKA